MPQNPALSVIETVVLLIRMQQRGASLVVKQVGYRVEMSEDVASCTVKRVARRIVVANDIANAVEKCRHILERGVWFEFTGFCLVGHFDSWLRNGGHHMRCLMAWPDLHLATLDTCDGLFDYVCAQPAPRNWPFGYFR